MRMTLVLGAALLLAGCTAPREGPPPADAAPAAPPPSPAPSPAPEPAVDPPVAVPSVPPVVEPPPPAPPAGPPRFETTIRDKAYEHPRVVVLPQTTIVWTNRDSEVHSVVGEVGIWLGSGPIPPGSSFSHTFEKPGEYRYSCRYHAGMAGTITVASTSGA